MSIEWRLVFKFFKDEIQAGERMFKGDSFQNLRAMIEKSLSPKREKKELEEENEKRMKSRVSVVIET